MNKYLSYGNFKTILVLYMFSYEPYPLYSNYYGFKNELLYYQKFILYLPTQLSSYPHNRLLNK